MLLRNASPWDWPMVVCKQIWHRIVCRIRCLDRGLFHLTNLMGKEVEYVQLRAVLHIDSMLQFRTTPIECSIYWSHEHCEELSLENVAWETLELRIQNVSNLTCEQNVGCHSHSLQFRRFPRILALSHLESLAHSQHLGPIVGSVALGHAPYMSCWFDVGKKRGQFGWWALSICKCLEIFGCHIWCLLICRMPVSITFCCFAFKSSKIGGSRPMLRSTLLISLPMSLSHPNPSWHVFQPWLPCQWWGFSSAESELCYATWHPGFNGLKGMSWMIGLPLNMKMTDWW